MKIFIVEYGWDYEGYNVDSVYATRDAAERKRLELERLGQGDTITVTEYEVQQ